MAFTLTRVLMDIHSISEPQELKNHLLQLRGWQRGRGVGVLHRTYLYTTRTYIRVAHHSFHVRNNLFSISAWGAGATRRRKVGASPR